MIPRLARCYHPLTNFVSLAIGILKNALGVDSVNQMPNVENLRSNTYQYWPRYRRSRS